MSYGVAPGGPRARDTREGPQRGNREKLFGLFLDTLSSITWFLWNNVCLEFIIF